MGNKLNSDACDPRAGNVGTIEWKETYHPICISLLQSNSSLSYTKRNLERTETILQTKLHYAPPIGTILDCTLVRVPIESLVYHNHLFYPKEVRNIGTLNKLCSFVLIPQNVWIGCNANNNLKMNQSFLSPRQFGRSTRTELSLQRKSNQSSAIYVNCTIVSTSPGAGIFFTQPWIKCVAGGINCMCRNG